MTPFAKAILSLAVLSFIGAGLSVGYYFGIFLPRQTEQSQTVQQKADLFSQNMKCEEYGENHYNDFDPRSVKADSQLSQMVGLERITSAQEFAYNPRLNACLKFHEMTITNKATGAIETIAEVIDMMKEKTLLGFDTACRDTDHSKCNTRQFFDQQKAILIGE